MSRSTFTTGQHRDSSIVNQLILNGTISELKFDTNLNGKILLTDQARTWAINQNAGGYQLKSLGDGTLSTDAINLSQLTNGLALKLDKTQLKTKAAGAQQINWATATEDDIPSAVAVRDYLTSAAVVIVSEEELTGQDGVEVDFTLDHTPMSGSCVVYLNGQRLRYGFTQDYTVATNVVTFNYAPEATDILVATYTYSMSGQESVVVSFTQEMDFGQA